MNETKINYHGMNETVVQEALKEFSIEEAGTLMYNNIYISDHAMKRIKERNGWGKKSSIRMIKKIYDEGLTPENVKGKYAAWVRNKVATANAGDYFRLYGESLYVFNKETLVTVLPTPRKGTFFNKVREMKEVYEY